VVAQRAIADQLKPRAIRLMPPLTVSLAELDAAVDVVDAALTQV